MKVSDVYHVFEFALSMDEQLAEQDPLANICGFDYSILAFRPCNTRKGWGKIADVAKRNQC